MIRVGVLRGGISAKYDQSLQTGSAVLNVLRERLADTYEPVDILITKDGLWHIKGRPISGEQLLASVDVIFNALHGTYGEDGQVQRFLEDLQIPYTGSGSVAGAVAVNRKMTKDILKEKEILAPGMYVVKDPHFIHGSVEEVYLKEEAQNIFLKFSPPWILKPASTLSPSVTKIAQTRNELLEALRSFTEIPGDILVEQYRKGKHASVVLLEGFRNQPLYTFLPIEIRGANDGLEAVSPGNFTSQEKEEMAQLAKEIYGILKLRHYALIDFIVTQKGIYLKDVTLLPQVHPESLISKSLAPLGVEMKDVIDHLIKSAIKI